MWPNEWPLTISRSLWPIFHGSVILPYILNTICWINVTPGILVPCDPMNDHLLCLGHCDLYFMVQWFCLISWIYLLDKCNTWDINSMWPNEWPLTISRSLWPIFHASVILPYILNTICWINVTPGILVPCDPMNDHLLYLGHCDLYFMLQWFCLISSNTICLINVTPGILVPCDPMKDHLLYLGHCDLYFMLQWFCLISWILFVG